jgi:hypothetical protein
VQQQLQQEQEKLLRDMEKHERFPWAKDHDIRNKPHSKKQKTEAEIADPEAYAEQKLRDWCGLKTSIPTMARKRAQQRVAQAILQGTGVDLVQNEGKNYIKALKWTSKETDRDDVRRVMIHDAPQLKPTHKIHIVCTNGLSVHLTYEVTRRPEDPGGGDDGGGGGGGGGDDDDDDDNPNDLLTTETPIDKLTMDTGVHFKGGKRPTRPLKDQVLVNDDGGVCEETIVATPAAVVELLERAAKGETLDEQSLTVDDAQKVKGLRQFKKTVWETIARTKQQRAAEQYSIVKVNRVLATALVPTTVQALQNRLRDLVLITNMAELNDVISARASVAPALLYTYFRPEYRQGRRSLLLAKKRFAEQLAHVIIDMAQPVAPRQSVRTVVSPSGKIVTELGPPQYYPAKRPVIGPFSERTRMRQQRTTWLPDHGRRPKLDKDLVLINGDWSRPTGNSGMARKAGSFPRVEIHNLMERSLAHLTESFFSCVIDEYRSSKQLHKLWALLGEDRVNKTTPKADTTAYTTNKDGELVKFTVHEKKFKLQQFTGRDGLVHVVGRDECTNVTFSAVYVFDHVSSRLKNRTRSRPVTISRASATDTAARSGARSRKAKETAGSP